jgi:hypothetical protein
MRKTIKTLLLTLLAAGVMAAVPVSFETHKGNSLASILKVEAKKKKKKTIAPIQLAGSGAIATQTFALQKGISIFEISHTGDSNFVVELLKSNGEWVDMPVNQIGNYSGKKAIGIDKNGTYLLNIEADGNWTVNITQPRPSSGVKKPITFTGTGDDVPQFMYFKKKGLARFNMSHTGESNFAIWLYDENGKYVDLLANEIGNYNGSKAVRIPKKGVYLLDITADGSWSVSVN